MAQRQIPLERQGLYYIGMAISVVGILLFVSVFVEGISSFGDSGFLSESRLEQLLNQPDGHTPTGEPNLAKIQEFMDPAARVRSMGTRALVGMAMMVIGGIMSGIARRGLAGSGILLDPEAARQDAEPWSRMTGGMVKDAMDEAGVNLGALSANAELPFDERLRRLQKLRDEGLVNEQEFEATKMKILESAEAGVAGSLGRTFSALFISLRDPGRRSRCSLCPGLLVGVAPLGRKQDFRSRPEIPTGNDRHFRSMPIPCF